MSANAWDASINQIRPVRQAGNVAVADVPNADPYDILCDITIGEDLNEHVDNLVLSVSVINLTTANQVLNIPVTKALTPVDDTDFFTTERVSFPAPSQSPGDVLQAVASVTVNAGSNTDFSSAQSATFVVS
jgi:hypothetical protein